jgi:serine/threonine protein kinase
LITDFCPGGELFFHLHNLGRFTEDQARFYFCEVLLALEHLHNEKIIFRDLKPENTLIDLDGHIKLVDFGLATLDTGYRQHTFCGSHEYLSPEMLKRVGYNKCIDFYSLGSFLYEMITGLPPFWDEDREKLYDKILNSEVIIHKYMSASLASLLRGLLRKDPTLRLGSILGVREIKQHPWLEGVNWESFRLKKIQPPFRPNSSRSNFECDGSLNEEKLKVFTNFQPFDSKKEQNFSEFFYVNPEKSRNHELVYLADNCEEMTSSKSFVEVKMQSPAHTSKYRSRLHESASKSPVLERGKKIGPEITSGKVAPKFVKNKDSKIIVKKNRPGLNKSFVNMRFSLSNSKVDIN